MPEAGEETGPAGGPQGLRGGGHEKIVGSELSFAMRSPDPLSPPLSSLAERAAAAAAASPVPSPCINVCRIEPSSGLCTGCLRTLEEIAAWSRLDEAGKREVWAALPARGAAAR